MGSGVSTDLNADDVNTSGVSKAQASAFMQEASPDQVIADLFTLLTAAYEAGVNIRPVQDHVAALLERPLVQNALPHPWEWSESALHALEEEEEFHKVEGFSHLERCIYKDKDDESAPYIDTRFEHELDNLFSAFYCTQSKEHHPLEIMEITAVHNENLHESMDGFLHCEGARTSGSGRRIWCSLENHGISSWRC
jgi:hypothetical protein